MTCVKDFWEIQAHQAKKLARFSQLAEDFKGCINDADCMWVQKNEQKTSSFMIEWPVITKQQNAALVWPHSRRYVPRAITWLEGCSHHSRLGTPLYCKQMFINILLLLLVFLMVNAEYGIHFKHGSYHQRNFPFTSTKRRNTILSCKHQPCSYEQKQGT